jgi:hypothetical protein
LNRRFGCDGLKLELTVIDFAWAYIFHSACAPLLAVLIGNYTTMYKLLLNMGEYWLEAVIAPEK